MANKMTCEWGGCEQVATHQAVFTSPHERVNYCPDCLPEVRQTLDYQRIRRL